MKKRKPIQTTRLDRYRLLQRIYEGEYTLVFIALHDLLGSQLAVKMLRPDAPPELGKALIQEGRIQTVVVHPYVVRVTDAFMMHGQPVLAMEYVKGESMADYLDAGPVPVELAVPLMRRIVRGVRAIHKRGIVHRDLKPENILLAVQGRQLRPRVTDFGFAKVLEQGKDPKPHGLSVSYRFIGTPEYMAPEQVDDPGRVDTRADLFSLGAMFYEMLTGKVCFEAPEETEILYRAARGEYVRLDELMPDLSPRIASIVHDLLEPRVERRIQSAKEVARRLDRLPYAVSTVG